MMPLLLIGTAVLLAVIAVVMLIRDFRLQVVNARVRRIMNHGSKQPNSVDRMSEWMSAIGQRYRRFYSPENLEQLRAVVQSSGLNPHRVMPILIGSKTASMFLLPILAFIAVRVIGMEAIDGLIVVGIAAMIGILGPRLTMRFIQRRFNKAVERGTPDAIDLLVVCSEAGMGLESALGRVTQEMSRSNRPMANVLDGLLDDLQVLPDRRDAFIKLGSRSTFEGIRRFGTMINQSLQYGTPISHALRAVADELRRDRITKLEDRAHKLGAKLIIPMVVFMLPAMGITMAASPFLHMIRAMRMINL